jgi:hypothetical protein
MKALNILGLFGILILIVICFVHAIKIERGGFA